MPSAIDDAFLREHAPSFADFWNRRRGDSRFELRFPAFGYEVVLGANDPALRDAARLSAARYARAVPLDGSPVIELELLVVPAWGASPVPSDLPARIQTVAVNDYLFQAATPWLQWFTALNARRAWGMLAPALARDARLVSRYLIDRAVLNILLREGVGQLHATSLVRDDHAVIFIAPHGTGKSTTAFHLLRCGYRLLGDGLLFMRERGGLELMGYPAGEAKLTPAMQPLFPEWRGAGDEVTVHNVIKTVVDLRELAPGKVVVESVSPQRVILCLAERNGERTTRAQRLSPDAALERILPDTVYWDEPRPMLRSLNVLRRLIESAAAYRLTLGTD